jgi:hypothetical protein
MDVIETGLKPHQTVALVFHQIIEIFASQKECVLLQKNMSIIP